MLRKLKLFDNRVIYNDKSVKKAVKGFDVGHIKIRSLSAEISNIGYTSKEARAEVATMSMKDTSGFVLDSLHGKINYMGYTYYG